MKISTFLKEQYPTIEELIKAYSTIGDDALFFAMKPVKEKGYLTKEQFIRIAHWKSARPLPLYKQNDEKNIIELSKNALFSSNEIEKITHLVELKGVSIATASAILTAVEPDKYGVIDIRVWEVLFHYGEVRGKESGSTLTIKQWIDFLEAIRRIATQCGMSVRKVEAALFLASQRNQIGRLYE
jgi:thermostable 8-oxoguanine DNA glycosylase